MRDETAATGGSLFGTGPNGIFRRTVPKPEEQTDRRMLRVLRYRRPDLPRGFRCPGMPVLGVLFSAWLMSFPAAETWLRFAGWLVLGLLVYALCSYRSTRRVMPGGSADLSSLDESGR